MRTSGYMNHGGLKVHFTPVTSSMPMIRREGDVINIPNSYTYKNVENYRPKGYYEVNKDEVTHDATDTPGFYNLIKHAARMDGFNNKAGPKMPISATVLRDKHVFSPSMKMG